MTNLAKIFLLLFGLLMLAGCGPSASEATPGIDPERIRTEAAATVLAQVTRDLALTPSATLAPTATSTQAPSATPDIKPTLTSVASATVTVSTTVTNTANLTNIAKWVSQTIVDGAAFLPGETFTMTWRIQNAGEATWTPAYWLRFFSGSAFGAASEIPLGQEVRPGEIVDLTIRMTAPTQPGEYRSDWVLATEARSNFKDPIFLKIVVVAPTTPTRTATVPAATATPTQ